MMDDLDDGIQRSLDGGDGAKDFQLEFHIPRLALPAVNHVEPPAIFFGAPTSTR